MSLLNFLIEKYQESGLRNRTTCIKYSFKFSNTTINVYFDCYDKEIPSLSLVFIHKPYYYLKGFNPNSDNAFNGRYLEDIPKQILKDILVDNQLKTFYEEMEKAIREKKHVRCNYEKDGHFKNTRKSQKKSKSDSINPFFSYLRRQPMKDEHLEALFANLNISKEKLKEVQNSGFNIVTTDDPARRRIFADEWKNINKK